MIHAVIKFGGSAITEKSKPFTANTYVIDQLAKELSQVNKKMVLVHGGGSYGHTVVLKYGVGIRTRYERLGSSKAKLAMQELNTIVCKALIRHGLYPYSIPPSCIFELSDGQVNSVKVKILRDLLKQNFLPVLYGDVVIDKVKAFTVLSGDEIVCQLAKIMKAKRVIFCLDVDGVYDDDPKKNPSAKLITSLSFKQVEELLSRIPQDLDATKGMYGKLSSILRLKDLGLRVYIINGRKPGLLREALLGEPSLATVIY